MTEIWRPMKGQEGNYEVSNLGRIKSLQRVIVRSNGAMYTVKEKIRKPSGSNGYVISFRVDGDIYAVGWARLIYENFIGEVPDGLLVAHKNGDKDDNRAENLTLANQTLIEAIKVVVGNRGDNKPPMIQDIVWRTNVKNERHYRLTHG